MALPTGSGSEQLIRASLRTNNGWDAAIAGVALHIYTILSVTFCEENNASITIGMRVDKNNAGSNQVNIMDYHTSLGGYQTFTWNDRFVMTGTDQLDVYSSAVCDIWVSYIDQDWT